MLIFCFHWLPTCQTHILTVLNKPHIYSLAKVMKQLIVWSAMVTDSTASYLLIVLLYCIIFCFHWFPICQTHILTVLNKPHIYSLSEIMKQLIVGSALVTASYLLISVLSSVFTGCLHVRLIY